MIRFTIVLLLFSLKSALCCLNTSFSQLEEARITGETVHLVLGQFAHHGARFYHAELVRTSRILERESENFMARNDRGAALVKLGQFDEAQTEFLQNRALHGGRYETESNLGVLYKKQGAYAEAADAIARALRIRPGGHMGLGDYYLRMLRWRAALVEDKGRPKRNFLGISYDAAADQLVRSDLVQESYVVALIRNAREFSDAYVVLGDLLAAKGARQLALRAYFRAEELGHPAPAVVASRIDSQLKSEVEGFEPVAAEVLRRQFAAERKAADSWLRRFERMEAKLIKRGERALIPETLGALGLAGIERPAMEPWRLRSSAFDRMIPVLRMGIVGLLVCAGLGIWAMMAAHARRMWQARQRFICTPRWGRAG